MTENADIRPFDLVVSWMWEHVMLNPPTDIPGFTHPGHISGFHRHRSAVFAQLVATLALVVAIAVVAAAVTMEIAEAGVLKSAPEGEGRFAFAAFAVFVTGALAGVMTLIAATPVYDDGMAALLFQKASNRPAEDRPYEHRPTSGGTRKRLPMR